MRVCHCWSKPAAFSSYTELIYGCYYFALIMDIINLHSFLMRNPYLCETLHHVMCACTMYWYVLPHRPVPLLYAYRRVLILCTI